MYAPPLPRGQTRNRFGVNAPQFSNLTERELLLDDASLASRPCYKPRDPAHTGGHPATLPYQGGRIPNFQRTTLPSPPAHLVDAAAGTLPRQHAHAQRQAASCTAVAPRNMGPSLSYSFSLACLTDREGSRHHTRIRLRSADRRTFAGSNPFSLSTRSSSTNAIPPSPDSTHRLAPTRVRMAAPSACTQRAAVRAGVFGGLSEPGGQLTRDIMFALERFFKV
jgi:hypothetical protein